MISKSRFIAFAGPLTIVVGAFWGAASLGDFAFRTWLAGDEALVGVVAIPFFLSFLPMLFALIGIRQRFHPAAGGLGRLGRVISVAGCAGVLASPLLGGKAPEAAWLNYAAAACALCIRIGCLLFGVDALRYRLLPRWNLVPVLLGATVVLSLPFEWFGAPALLPLPWVTPPFCTLPSPARAGCCLASR